MGKAIRVLALVCLGISVLAAQEAIYPDAVIAEHQVGLFTNRQTWPPQVLQATISPTASSFTVGTSAGLVTPTVVQIKDEIIKVSSESAGTITVWSVSGITVSNCTNTAPIVVTTGTDHNFTGAERVTITGVGGNTACNVTNAPITRVGATTFELDGTTGSGAFTVSGSLSATGRGYDGTTAATHLAGTTVTANVVSAQLTQMFREIQALETAGPASGGVAGIANDIQVNVGGSHGAWTDFQFNGESLRLPRSTSSPALEGGQFTLQGDTGSGVGDTTFDIYSGDLRIFANDGSNRTLQYFNAGAGTLNVTYDGNVTMNNDKIVYWKDTSGVPIEVLKLNSSNIWSIGPAANLPGTPDVWFYKDGVVVSKFSTDGSTGEVSLIPSTDQDRQVGAYDAMWQRIIGLRVDVGRSTSTTEVQGTLALHTGVSGYASPTIIKGITEATQFPSLPVLNAAEFAGSLIPSQNDVYVLGSDGLSGGGTGAVRRWAEAHIKDLYVASCTGCGAAGHPVTDTTSIVEDNSDPTKEIRFELGGLTTGTIRVLTPQNASYTLAGLETTQTFTGTNTFNTQMFTNHILPTTGSTMSIGSASLGSNQTYANGYIQDIRSLRIRIGAYSELGTTDYHRWEIGSSNVSNIENSAGDPLISFDSTGLFSPSSVDIDGVRIDADLLPYTSGDFYMGSTSYRWKELHADKGFFPSGVTAGVTSGAPGCVSGSPASGGDNGRLYWDNSAGRLYVCTSGTSVQVYP